MIISHVFVESYIIFTDGLPKAREQTKPSWMICVACELKDNKTKIPSNFDCYVWMKFAPDYSIFYLSFDINLPVFQST